METVDKLVKALEKGKTWEDVKGKVEGATGLLWGQAKGKYKRAHKDETPETSKVEPSPKPTLEILNPVGSSTRRIPDNRRMANTKKMEKTKETVSKNKTKPDTKPQGEKPKWKKIALLVVAPLVLMALVFLAWISNQSQEENQSQSQSQNLSRILPKGRR